MSADVPPAAHLAPDTGKAPVEQKVTAAAAGGLGGTQVGEFAVWLLGRYAFHGDVPPEVRLFVLGLATSALAALAGYLAPHTDRQEP